MFNIRLILDSIPRMTYEEHDNLVQLELINYYSNVLHGRLPANEHEINFANDVLDLLMLYNGNFDSPQFEAEKKKLVDDYSQHADFARMRHYLTPITLSFLTFPDYDEETNTAIGRFHDERYAEHEQSQPSQNNENA